MGWWSRLQGLTGQAISSQHPQPSLSADEKKEGPGGVASDQEKRFSGTVKAVKSVMATKNARMEKDCSRPELEVDASTLDMLIMVIQDAMQDQQDPSDKRWPRKLQWPSQKYLRASWLYVCEQMQPDIPKFVPGEAKVSSANAGHVACMGPCLLQAPVPVHTLIVHGDLEYCTLLGHRLHIDVQVYFAALRTLANFLKGNQHLRELVFAFTGCPESVTDSYQQPITEYFASQVLPAFEQALSQNDVLKYISFRACYRPTQHVNLRRLCATSFEANCRQRAAVVSARHTRATTASPLAACLPQDVLKRILDLAFPMQKPPKVDFEFSHYRTAVNRCRFSFLRLSR